MSKRSRQGDRQDTGTSAPLSSNPFAALGPCEPIEAPEPAPASEPAPELPASIPRAVVRYQRKGHGGKDVTRIEKLGLLQPELAVLAGELRRALGCGGRVDGDDIVLSGDQRERARALLEARGVRRVTTS